MAAIKGAHTKPKMAIRQALLSRGFRYHLHQKELPVRQDLVF
jgi:DNA mismatch endonuclease (patch repair protein)